MPGSSRHRAIAQPRWLLGVALVAALAAGCESEPCAPDDPRPECAAGDMGVGACWSPAGQPITTTARVEPTISPGVLGCDQLVGGRCVAGPLIAAYGSADPTACLPATTWATRAIGEGCPDRSCERAVGGARGHLDFGRLFPEPQVELRCAALPRPGGAPAIERERVRGIAPPGEATARAPVSLIDCARRHGFEVTRFGQGPARHDRYRLEAQFLPVDGPVLGPNQRLDHCAEHARRVGEVLACAQAACAALNTWAAPVDPDGDGYADQCDRCPVDADPEQRDTDRDGQGDVCDADDDGDGVPDLDEPALGTDPLDRDTDDDGWPDGDDRCPLVADDGADRDRDGFGDACDPCPDDAGARRDQDDDRDGVAECRDTCPGLANPGPAQADLDGDGLGDLCDLDPDGDALLAEAEAAAGTDPLDPDTDADGWPDGDDNCPTTANPGQEEADRPSNGAGDACDLPLAPEQAHPDAPPAADQVVWIDAVRVVPPQTVPEALLHHGQALLDAAAESYFDRPMMINDPPPPPDQPPALRGPWSWVQAVIGQLIDEFEDQSGQTIGIVLGRAYEQWAGNTYCHSNAHALAFAEIGRDPEDACRREVVIPRTTHDFDNPQPLWGTMRRTLRSGEIREYRFPRKRRHDCHCRGVAGRIAPLSEEYKASRSARRQYRARYHRWLVAQCKDYRFTLARLTHEALPHLGSLREIYGALFESRRIGRPALLYRLLRQTGAMRAVLEACRFAEFADDAGVMPEAEVIERRRARPERPWSQMQSRVSIPAWRVPPDGVRGCEGGVVQHYLARGCPAQPGVQAPPGLGHCAPEARRWGIYTRCSPGFDVADDPFVRPGWDHFETGASSPWLPIIEAPVCPPEWMNAQAALIWEQMRGVDRLRSRVEAEGFAEFFDHFAALHWWGYPLWIGTSHSGVIPQPALRGHWLITHEDVYMDFGLERMGPLGDPLSPIDAPPPIFDGVVGIPELEVDPDEARDACFD